MLLAFDAVCRHRNITAAARELSLTQPAVSKSLKKLDQNSTITVNVKEAHIRKVYEIKS